MVECAKNKTGSESGTGEGDVSGRGMRTAISAYGVLVWEHNHELKGRPCLHGKTTTACRSDTGMMRKLGARDSMLTSETPLARRALIFSSLSSGQAMGDAEAAAVR